MPDPTIPSASSSTPASTPPDSPGAKKPKTDAAFWKNTGARFLTAAIGIPILLWLMFVAPPLGFQLLVYAAIARAAYELFRMTMDGAPALLWAGIGATLAVAGVLLFYPQPEAYLTLMFALPAAGALLGLSYPQPNRDAGVRTAWLMAGPLYVGALMASVGRLHQLESGGQWVLLAMWLAWASDTGAYFAGRYFGKTKLAPSVSPSKTVEGALGGLGGSLTGGLAAHFWFLPNLPLVHAVVLALVAGALGQAGDLAESLIKRSTGFKDSGNLLPGHGGLLDRVDALMFTGTTCLLYNLWLAG